MAQHSEKTTTLIDITTGAIVFSAPHANSARELVQLALSNNISLKNCNFSDMDLTGIHFQNCDLTGANFGNAILDGCVFRNCSLQDVLADGAMLRNTRFETVKIGGASFMNARFSDAILIDTSFASGVCLYDTVFDHCRACGITAHSMKSAQIDMAGVEILVMTGSTRMPPCPPSQQRGFNASEYTPEP